MGNSTILGRATRRRIEAASRAMPARRRIILLAIAIEQTSYAEIGRQLDLDPAVVEQEFARALVELADAADPRPSWSRRLTRRLAAWIGR